MKNHRIFKNNIHASGLPKRFEIKNLIDMYGIKSVIDLSDRERLTVKKACKDFKIEYYKFSIDEYNPDINLFKEAINIAQKGNVLIHCYRGVHRTGILLDMLNLDKIDENNFKNHIELKKILCSNN